MWCVCVLGPLCLHIIIYIWQRMLTEDGCNFFSSSLRAYRLVSHLPFHHHRDRHHPRRSATVSSLFLSLCWIFGFYNFYIWIKKRTKSDNWTKWRAVQSLPRHRRQSIHRNALWSVGCVKSGTCAVCTERVLIVCYLQRILFSLVTGGDGGMYARGFIHSLPPSPSSSSSSSRLIPLSSICQ